MNALQKDSAHTWNGRCDTNVNAKLTRRQVDWILRNPRGLTNEQLAKRYGVTAGHIGRIRRGHRWAAAPKATNYNAKLDPRKVRRMRRLVAKGATITSVAELYGVSLATASQAVNRLTWRDV